MKIIIKNSITKEKKEKKEIFIKILYHRKAMLVSDFVKIGK